MKNLQRLSLILFLFFGSLQSGFATPVDSTNCNNEPQPSNYRNQELANQYIQDGMYNFWHGDQIKANESTVFKGITLRGKLGVVEYDFAKAAELAPNRLDIKFDLASTQILQNKTPEAITTYQEILTQDPQNLNALILSAGYMEVLGKKESVEQYLAHAKTINPQRTEHYVSILAMAAKNFKLQLNVTPKKITGNFAIVVLGYALADDGTPQPTLIERLKVALAEYKLNPQAAIIVSGGMPHGGVTESYIMKQWLIKNGVPAPQIYIEDQSKDTVMNAIYSLPIVNKLAAKQIVLISSASHMRRAYSVFTALDMKQGGKIAIDNLVYLDYPDLAQASQVNASEKLVIIRDVLRAAGIWAYPGIQQ